MGRVTGGDLVVQLKGDVAELRQSFTQMERRMGESVAEMRSALERTQRAIDGLGAVVREGFSDVGKALDRFATHLDAHTEVLGELTAKVNEHEDRIAALESKH